MDSLARSSHPWLADRRQRLLHGLSLHFAATTGATLAAGRPRLAARLRNKWLAVILLVGFFWAYEVCSLWNSPWWTAWIVLAISSAAFAVDGFFRSGTFCKYVCPIGQFNFVQSLISPLEVKVREPVVCASCRTKDCIRGRGDIPGCELQLFQPHKSSNMDCTFCLDCIHACPHENVGILAVGPAAELCRDPYRSGIGRFGRRADLAALVVVLVFGAFINAAGMTGPVVAWKERVRLRMGGVPPWINDEPVRRAVPDRRAGDLLVGLTATS